MKKILAVLAVIVLLGGFISRLSLPIEPTPIELITSPTRRPVPTRRPSPTRQPMPTEPTPIEPIIIPFPQPDVDNTNVLFIPLLIKACNW